MPAGPPQKGGVFMGSQPPLFSGLTFPFWLARKEIYWVWVAALAEQAVFPRRLSVSPCQLRMDVPSQPQAMSPWEGSARSPSCPYGTWQRHKDAPGCLIAQGGGEKQASCLLRSELC